MRSFITCYSSPSVIRIIKEGEMGKAVHALSQDELVYFITRKARREETTRNI
jgi:hypothetical protein